MDKYTEMMLPQTGLLGMIGKSERGDIAITSIKKHGAVSLMAVAVDSRAGVIGLYIKSGPLATEDKGV